jgi:hypothetical protein
LGSGRRREKLEFFQFLFESFIVFELFELQLLQFEFEQFFAFELVQFFQLFEFFQLFKLEPFEFEFLLIQLVSFFVELKLQQQQFVFEQFFQLVVVQQLAERIRGVTYGWQTSRS